MMYAWVATSVGVGLLITFLALVAYNLDQVQPPCLSLAFLILTSIRSTPTYQ